MAQSNYQEPIEKEDLDLKKKMTGVGGGFIAPEAKEPQEQEKETFAESESKETEGVSPEGEFKVEAQEEKVSEKIETARKTLNTQKPAAVTSVTDDAKAVSQIDEYEKKLDKLVELALQRGPEHAIKVAEHLDANDNYTLDELHDRMIADDLRSQLVSKGLLKEL
ncbi:MAG: hypothetical protein WC858_02905 [Parcubacteria group bacterium]|jgi:hypothetical protein